MSNSDMDTSKKVASTEFKWGKKRGLGKGKGFQFYESFTYNGVEYFLYDCVYVYKEGEPEPYIGKLVKIWEEPKKAKIIKTIWFFRPIEIAQFLRDTSVLENEIFLACGEGRGLSNLNPLDVIDGKCNVICTSKDNRNIKPSDVEIKMADYIFYRAFDVKKLTLSNELGDSIGGIDVRYFFNRVDKRSIPRCWVTNESERISVDVAHQLDSNLTVKPELDSEVSASVKIEYKSISSDDALIKPKVGLIQPKADADEVIASTKEVNTEVKSATELGSSKKVVLTEKPLNLKGISSVSKENASLPNMTSDELIKGPGNFISLEKEPDVVKKSSVNGRMHMETHASSPVGDAVFEVIRRPEEDRSRWFKAFPWEERMQTAKEQGTILLLENLDPSYTSSDIEDIIWSGFKEKCTAKVLARSQFCSPYSGQAFVIFRSKDVASSVFRKLNENCLMLPGGRLLVCSKGNPRHPDKPSKFVGHISIRAVKRQMHREEARNAVSTSHCSQPNTIEYEMAMEWRVLQKKVEIWWTDLFKKQEAELVAARKFLNK